MPGTTLTFRESLQLAVAQFQLGCMQLSCIINSVRRLHFPGSEGRAFVCCCAPPKLVQSKTLLCISRELPMLKNCHSLLWHRNKGCDETVKQVTVNSCHTRSRKAIIFIMKLYK